MRSPTNEAARLIGIDGSRRELWSGTNVEYHMLAPVPEGPSRLGRLTIQKPPALPGDALLELLAWRQKRLTETTMRIMLVILIALVWHVSPALASQEMRLPLSKFTITSSGNRNLGEVIVDGEMDHTNNISAITVRMCNKVIRLDKAIIDKLALTNCNGVLVSGEIGYIKYGERVIYITFILGSSLEISEAVVVAVGENGTVEIVQRRR